MNVGMGCWVGGGGGYSEFGSHKKKYDCEVQEASENNLERKINSISFSHIGHSAFLLVMALACIGLDQIALWPFATVAWHDRRPICSSSFWND